MAARNRKETKPAGRVVSFPPLPRIPAPPVLPDDPRQRRAGHILGKIAEVAQTSMDVAGPNLVRGFHASAVDLGRLQDALRRGLSRFDSAQLEARWPEVGYGVSSPAGFSAASTSRSSGSPAGSTSRSRRRTTTDTTGTSST